MALGNALSAKHQHPVLLHQDDGDPRHLGMQADGIAGFHILPFRMDLLRVDGPQISTVRNYNFAILPYAPEDEFALRRAVHELSGELRDGGWTTGTVVLHSLLLARLRAQGSDFIESLVRREKSLAGAADPTRGMRLLKERIVTLLEGPDGLAADVIAAVERILGESANPNRTVIFLGRAGALYPFFRTSALLKHVAGHTRNVPVVLLSNRFAVAVPTQAPKAFYVTVAVSAPLRRPTAFHFLLALVVSNVLLALGMQMMSPTQVSLPFKLLLFVAIVGWGLLAASLVSGYHH